MSAPVADTRPFFKPGKPAYHTVPFKVRHLRNMRIGAQLFFLALWVFLFLQTRSRGDDPAALRPDLFLITDPLVALLTIGSSRVLVPVLAISAFFIVFTLVFGRAFCSWICPLGTLIDGSKHIFRPPAERFTQKTHESMQRWKYYLLVFMAFGALLGAQWVFLFDPLVLMFRGATSIYPVAAGAIPVAWLPKELGVKVFEVPILPIVLFLGSIGLTAVTPRFWCRYLCPLGAFYGLLSKQPLLRRRVKGCDVCHGREVEKECVSGCRMGAVPVKPGRTQNHECIRCFSGAHDCHKDAIQFGFMKPVIEKSDQSLDLDRRAFLTGGATAMATAPLVALAGYHRGGKNNVIRPPMVIDEDTFQDQCIRCAMCVQACPTQTLQLTHLEAGIAGFWTPAITPLAGGCVAGCNACSVACPTDAIPKFSKEEADKWSVKMGTAVLETNRCVSYTEKAKCLKCVEICPTRAFSIESGPGIPTRPTAVDYNRCVGCGLCELACSHVVYGTPALLTFSHGRGQPTSLAELPTEKLPRLW
jgi:polyferredoxin/ferredoxin-like protein FixX